MTIKDISGVSNHSVLISFYPKPFNDYISNSFTAHIIHGACTILKTEDNVSNVYPLPKDCCRFSLM